MAEKTLKCKSYECKLNAPENSFSLKVLAEDDKIYELYLERTETEMVSKALKAMADTWPGANWEFKGFKKDGETSGLITDFCGDDSKKTIDLSKKRTSGDY